MDTAANCAFNLTRKTVLSSRVTVADATHEPLKALVLLIDKLGVDSGSAVWLTPLSAAPEIPRLFSFDLIYLDRRLRIVDCVAMKPGVDLPACKRQVVSALVLPERTISSSRTQRGDQLRIEAESEADRQPATSLAQDNINPMQAADLEPAGQILPELSSPDDLTAADFANSAESFFEPFPGSLIYMPTIDATNRLSPNSFEGSFPKPPANPARTESRDELPVTVPTWALHSSIGELIESAETDVVGSPEAVAPLEQLETLSAMETAPLVSPAPADVPEEPLAAGDLPIVAPILDARGVADEPALPNELTGPPLNLNDAPSAPQFTWAQSHGWLLSNHTAGAPAGNRAKTTTEQQEETKPDIKKPVEAGTAEAPEMAAPLNTSPTETAALSEADTPAPSLPIPPYPEEWRYKLPSLATRFQRWLDADLPGNVIGPVDRRSACRIRKPNLVAFYWSGGMPKPHHIADISATGVSLLLQPDDRWIPETILRITLQRTDRQEERFGHSITVLAKVVRAGSDTVGHQFVMEEKLNRHFRDILPFEGTDKQALERFLAPLQY